jgi:hypothetical protein
MPDSIPTNAETPPQPTQPASPVATAKAKWHAASTPVKAGIVGGVAAGGCFLLLLCCACPLVSWTFLGGGAGQKLVGKWEGKKKAFGQDLKFSVEFKSNGRYLAVDGLEETWTGSWKVKLVEDSNYHLNLVDDSEPDRIKGWTVKFKDNDTINIDGFVALNPTLKRKR